ncbi:hypothetical protein OZL92_17680 [Bacillus sonorensis]|uniref:Uncharacterized protein n=3 Tax=Bacillus sonorensis TaxID=119858 RepID=M5P6E6_9BACI|nr:MULTISPECIES: hypothetical protein [Bacillus]ASB89191.1 Cell wall-binding protein YqgA [Bacillus sonorensis]EME75586.1 Hypothetical protein YqgA [Bacillus sonorensis L12]MBG9915134.1 hypothetical protein [Bacillus sonorensis]MCY8026828.1 hypothetical protein [Bacillus sonorensis]MCY8403616.1 hypothetical protein [Bacillus sonorensis]
MKKVLRLCVLFGVTMAILLGFSPQNASAAWSDWQSFDGFKQGCKVRVYTDALNYSSKASTVDVKAEQNGNCGTIYYNMFLSWKGSDSVSIGSNVPTGSFTSNTPLKSINIIHQQEKTDAIVYLEMKKSSDGDILYRAKSQWLTVE